jgi:hypothetical protein
MAKDMSFAEGLGLSGFVAGFEGLSPCLCLLL